MNKERLLQLAEVLESERAEKHFDMGSYFDITTVDERDGDEPADLGIPPEDFINECGTTACIAGWAIVRFDPQFKGRFYHTRATELLGLDSGQAHRLFASSDAMRITSPKEAARVVRNLAETGEIDWSILDED